MKLDLRSEFRCSMIGFGGISSIRFYHSMWNLPPLLIMLYKFTLMAYCLAMLSWEAANYPPNHKPYPIFLTHWTYIVLCLYITVSAIITIGYHLKRVQNSDLKCAYLCRRLPSTRGIVAKATERDASIAENDALLSDVENIPATSPDFSERLQPLPWFVKICWILHSVACVAISFVTIMYFAALYPSEHEHGGISMADLQMHGISSVVLLLDFSVNSIPVRLLHLVYPASYLTIYLFFSVFYWVADHRHVIYGTVLDWNEPRIPVVVCLAAIVLAFLLHILFFLLHKLKLYARECCSMSSY